MDCHSGTIAQNEHAEVALKLFTQCKKREFQPILYTIVFNPFLCPYLIRRGYAFDAVNMTALINMYAKCKTINSAEMIFGTGSISSDIIFVELNDNRLWDAWSWASS